MGKGRSDGKPDCATNQGHQRSFGKEDGSHGEFACAQSLHQSDFGAALEDRGRHGGGYSQPRGKESCKRDQKDQSLDTGQHCAFILCDLANLFGVRVRHGFGELQRNRLRIGRAVPAIVDCARETFGITAGEGIFGLGECTYVDAADGIGFAKNLLRQSEWGDDLIVFRAARGKNSADKYATARSTIRGGWSEYQRVARFKRPALSKPLANENIARTIVGPCARNLPPRVRRSYPSGEGFVAIGKRFRKIGSDERFILPVIRSVSRHGYRQHGRK